MLGVINNSYVENTVGLLSRDLADRTGTARFPTPTDAAAPGDRTKMILGEIISVYVTGVCVHAHAKPR